MTNNDYSTTVILPPSPATEVTLLHSISLYDSIRRSGGGGSFTLYSAFFYTSNALLSLLDGEKTSSYETGGSNPGTDRVCHLYNTAQSNRERKLWRTSG